MIMTQDGKIIMKNLHKLQIAGVLRKTLKCIGIIFLVLIIIGLVRPTWTPAIEGDRSISELRGVDINGTELEVLIRGKDRNNPVLFFVHGGPCCSEIPYVRKYQEDLENRFTIVHYDQRGSGKSFSFGADSSEITIATHVKDLIALTEYIEEYLAKEQVILAGHSFGTYIATVAVSQRPELYQAYIGIGQMSDPIQGELNNLEKCIEAAEQSGDEKDVAYLKSLEEAITKGDIITPRNYVRKYDFAARKIDDNFDYFLGFLFGTEYNMADVIRFYSGSIKYQDKLIEESVNNPLTQVVTRIEVPTYFVMGKYDGMTSPKEAEAYLNSLSGEGEKLFVLFEESAHYPQFEETQKFYQWLKETFGE